MQSARAKAVRTPRSFRLITVVGFLALACTGCPNPVEPPPPPPELPELPDLGGRTIVVAVLEDNLPFSKVDNTTARAAGFDIDLINAIARKLNFQPRFVALDPDATLTNLDSGTYDMVAGGILYTLERAAQVDFTFPYALAKQRLAVRGDDHRAAKIVEFHDLDELQVGAVPQTIASDVAHKYFGADRMSSYDTATEAMQALAAGEVDGVALGTTEFDAADQAEPAVFRRLPGTLAGNIQAYALQQGSDLTQPISQALYKLHIDGVVSALRDTWGF